MRALLVIAVVAVVSLGACGGDKAGAEPTEAKDLGGTGFVVDAPKSWKVTEDMPNWFSLEDGRGKTQAQVRLSDLGMAASLDELRTSRCDGQQDVTAETLAGGGFAVSCVGPSQGIKLEGTEITTTKVEVQIPAGEGKAITCAWETDKPAQAKLTLAACSSIRKK